MDIQTNIDILMQADLKDWHYYENKQKIQELIALLKAREKADNKEEKRCKESNRYFDSGDVSDTQERPCFPTKENVQEPPGGNSAEIADISIR